MGQNNILNPTVTSALNPDYSVKVTDPQVISRWQARSGKPFMRRLSARGQVFDLTWANRMFADYQALRQWFAQYENDFFTYADWDFARYYSGMFADQPQVERAGNNRVNINAQFVVVPTLPLYQYPSNWAQDGIFAEERGDFPIPPGASPTINDLVKLTPLTGAWDHRDQNYILWSQDFENAAWAKGNGIVVTADQVAAPDGTVTADLLTSGNQATSAIFQQFTAFADVYTVSFSVRAGTSSQAAFALWDPTASAFVAATASVLSGPGAVSAGPTFTVSGLTAAWTRVSFTVNSALVGGRAYQVYILPNSFNANTLTNYVWGVQVETSSSASLYTFTGASTAALLSPNANTNYHGGSAYFDNGTIISDAAEWLYFGYGFQLWSPKGPAMGIVQISLDTVVQGNVDLYAAALAASAPLFTLTNVPLGIHRITLNPTNTKNGASAGFIVCADAIQVMR